MSRDDDRHESELYLFQNVADADAAAAAAAGGVDIYRSQQNMLTSYRENISVDEAYLISSFSLPAPSLCWHRKRAKIILLCSYVTF